MKTLLVFFLLLPSLAFAWTVDGDLQAGFYPGHNEEIHGRFSYELACRYYTFLGVAVDTSFIDFKVGVEGKGCQKWRRSEIAGHGLDYYNKPEAWDLDRFDKATIYNISAPMFGKDNLRFEIEGEHPWHRREIAEDYWMRVKIIWRPRIYNSDR